MVESYRIFGPALRALDAEAAHRLTIAALRLGLVRRRRRPGDTRLATRVWSLSFANPLGLAAGFDKNGEVMDAMLSLGFGFVEIGTVTPRAQAGNPRPRLFRLPADRAVINRLGFNNDGAAVVAARLAHWRQQGGRGLVGVNIGPNRDESDPAAACAGLVRTFAPLADYLVINLSSPNTPGLRELQAGPALDAILGMCRAARAEARVIPPLLVKIAPDLTDGDLAAIAAVLADGGAEGVIVSNTTTDRPHGLRGRHRDETGGLSGRPLFAASTALLSRFYALTGGRMPLIGAGGIGSGSEAYAKIRAGASLVQLYTALVYGGPGLIGRILADLAKRLEADGFATVSEAVGADHRTPPAGKNDHERGC